MNFKTTHPLQHIIAALSAKNIELGRARNDFLAKKAEKDWFEAGIVKMSPGESNAEKTMNAKSQQEWLEFHKRLNRLEAEFEFIKFQLKILELEYQAQYLALKQDEGQIKKEQ